MDTAVATFPLASHSRHLPLVCDPDTVAAFAVFPEIEVRLMPCDQTPAVTYANPVKPLESTPVPPYSAPTLVAAHVPATTEPDRFRLPEVSSQRRFVSF